METASGKETIIVLRRLIAYSEKIFQLSKDIVTLVSDRREKPRISTAAAVKSSLVLFWARMGSSNAREQLGRTRFWQRWLGEPAGGAVQAVKGAINRRSSRGAFVATQLPRGVTVWRV
jgi:hypothetical protein